MRDYCVYKHIVPNGKCYIGLTSNVSFRWSYGGALYKQSKLFFPYIKEYGWDNIKHTILQSNLTLEEAQELERKYIREAKDAGISLNVVAGGAFGGKGTKRSAEQRKRIGDAHRGLKQNRTVTKSTLKKDSKWRFVEVEIYKEGRIVGTFDNLHQASREIGVARKNLQRSIKSGKPTKTGYLVTKK